MMSAVSRAEAGGSASRVPEGTCWRSAEQLTDRKMEVKGFPCRKV